MAPGVTHPLPQVGTDLASTAPVISTTAWLRWLASYAAPAV